jgi:hypothetical protein
MKNKDVEIGKVYRVKVSGTVQDVRITSQNPHGGWDGVNVATKRPVRIKSPQRLRGLAAARPAKRQKVTSLAQYEAQGKQDHQGAATTAPGGAGAKTADQPAQDAKPARKRATGEPGATSRGPSGLAAAAAVLAEAGEPLNTKTMVERMLAKGLWKTGGKTPAATIYAAILRECATKGADARFRKVERGKFELAK